jgi:hypothetical protein
VYREGRQFPNGCRKEANLDKTSHIGIMLT